MVQHVVGKMKMKSAEAWPVGKLGHCCTLLSFVMVPDQQQLLSPCLPLHSPSPALLPHLCKQFPGPTDGFLLEIVPKGPVAKHLKEGVVVHILADIVKVVVLAT